MWAPTRPVLLMMLPFVTGACAARSATNADLDVIDVQPPSRVYVTNNNRLDVRVFAFDNTQSLPLGTVSSYATEVFELPTSILTRGQVRIMADPIGDVTAYVTDVITFGRGQDIEVVVQNNLQLSSYSLR